MELDGLPIIRTARKTLCLSFTREGVLVIRAPFHLPETIIQRFVIEQASWIEKHKNKTPPLPKRTFQHKDTLAYLGEEILIDHVPTARESLTLEAGVFHLRASQHHRARLLFLAWYKREARRYLQSRVTEWATIMQVSYATIRISNARHTWGSCTPDNRLNFTWRLLMSPPEVIDYVVIHELAHTKHKHHGKRFWDCVARFYPEYKKHRDWLHVHGHTLDL